jgi:hypothetical protein
VCPLTTRGKFKKTRNVHPSPFHFSSSASPRARALGQKVLEETSLFPRSDDLRAVKIDVRPSTPLKTTIGVPRVNSALTLITAITKVQINFYGGCHPYTNVPGAPSIIHSSGSTYQPPFPGVSQLPPRPGPHHSYRHPQDVRSITQNTPPLSLHHSTFGRSYHQKTGPTRWLAPASPGGLVTSHLGVSRCYTSRLGEGVCSKHNAEVGRQLSLGD